MEEEQKKKYKLIRICIQVAILGILIGFATYAIIMLYPIFVKIQDNEIYREEFIEKIRSFGSFSWLILIGLQIVQTVLAIIPSGPIVILAGIMYPPVLAVIICLVGQTLGALVVIGLVKLFGYSFLSLFIDPEQPKKFKLLEDRKRCGVLMFSYLLIPILPKDPIAFIVPFTKVHIKDFIIINTIARTPMTIVSVLLGNSIVSSNMGMAFIIGGISAVVALLCFIFNKRIVEFIDKITKKTPEEVE
ncbi:MAG: VTT domain-containing protein [Anaeroplasmataceae bacterium]|nr:VTT domain-containing protein [Anaeroplasmataceae bacterium]